MSLSDVTPSVAAPAALSAEFRRLFDAEFGYVCRSLQRLGVRGSDLQDVAQELFVAIHHHLPGFDRSRPLRPWLFSFSLRFAANYRRLMRNRGHLPEAVLRVHADAASNGIEARDLVLRALGELDFERRAVIVMHDLEGFAAPEIAELLGIPLNTAYSRLRLGRSEFRAAVERLQVKTGAS